MVVGVSAMIAPFIMDRDIIKRDLIINLIVSVSLCLFIFDGILGRMDGVLLLIGLVTFMMVLIVLSCVTMWRRKLARAFR